MKLKSYLVFSEIPERIEIYDNSHIQGKFAVGVMVVAGKVGFDKKEYRVFNVNAPSLVCHSRFRGNDGIKNCGGDIKGDDYEMLRQVLTRRLTRLRQEPHKLPSLMIIDGGKGHLGVVKEVMDKFEMNIPLFVCQKE